MIKQEKRKYRKNRTRQLPDPLSQYLNKVSIESVIKQEVQEKQDREGKPFDITWNFSSDSTPALEDSLHEKELSPKDLLHLRGECEPCAYLLSEQMAAELVLIVNSAISAQRVRQDLVTCVPC